MARRKQDYGLSVIFVYLDDLVGIVVVAADLHHIAPLVPMVVDQSLLYSSGMVAETESYHRSDNVDLKFLAFFEEVAEEIIVVSVGGVRAECIAIRQYVTFI